MLDALVAPAVEGSAQASPPASPAPGSCYVVAAAPTGAWAGQADKLAQYTSGGWRFLSPAEGMTLYVRSSGQTVTYRLGAWETGQLRGSSLILGGAQVVAARGAAIASPTGGATVDGEARTAIGLILGAMRLHGLIET